VPRPAALQGSAADLAKTAMLCIHERLAELGPGAAELLLMVHDELVLEVEQGRLEQVGGARAGSRGRPCQRACTTLCAGGAICSAEEHGRVRSSEAFQCQRCPWLPRVPQAAALVRAAMEEEAPARLGITVPLRVRLSSGPSWGELRELQPGAAQDEHAAAGS
jgi:hypothetical protein